MTVSVQPNGTIRLSGACGVDEAETLLQKLLMQPTQANADVDWSACESAHTAVVQVLLVGRVRPSGTPSSDFLRERIAPLLNYSAHPPIQ